MLLEYILDFGARILIGEEPEVAIGERLISTEKDAEFLEDRGETFGKETGCNQGGGGVVAAIIRNHTQVQIRHVVLLDKVKEFREMGKENAEIFIVGTAFPSKRDTRLYVEVLDGLHGYRFYPSAQRSIFL